jgi:hypothetical protein
MPRELEQQVGGDILATAESFEPTAVVEEPMAETDGLVAHFSV